MEVEYDFREDHTRRCKIKQGFAGVGKEGQYFGNVMVGQRWAIVLFDGEEDPELFKTSGLLVEEKEFKPIIA
jgi:hypothetical protein